MAMMATTTSSSMRVKAEGEFGIWNLIFGIWDLLFMSNKACQPRLCQIIEIHLNFQSNTSGIQTEFSTLKVRKVTLNVSPKAPVGERKLSKIIAKNIGFQALREL